MSESTNNRTTMEFAWGNSTSNAKQTSETAFHTLVIADTGGSVSTEAVPLAIDRDNFTQVLTKINPQLSLLLNDDNIGINISITSLEDFEPDNLFHKLPVFNQLKLIRSMLLNPKTIAQAKALIGFAVNESPQAITQQEHSDVSLEAVVSATEQRSHEGQEQSFSESLIKNIIAPYIEPIPDPQQHDLVASIDHSISELMRKILHHPDFQRLEATWRGLCLLVSQVETSSQLKFFVFSASKDQLLSDFTDNAVENSIFYKNAIAPSADSPNGTPWSLMIADFDWNTSPIDVCLMDILSQLATSQNAALIGQASYEFAGLDKDQLDPDPDTWRNKSNADFQNAWNTLRQQSYSQHLGLCFPHVLLRPPYGENTRPITAFTFEEIIDQSHQQFLWGNAAYIVAILLCQSFQSHGWNFKPGIVNQYDQMPLYFYEDEYGDKVLLPSAEILLTEAGAQKLLRMGLLPIWSVADSTTVRVGPLQAAADRRQLIKGRWKSH